MISSVSTENPLFQIPLQNDLLDFQLEVDLDGTTYQLRFRWCDTLNGSVIADGATTGAWYMDINTPEGVPLIQGLRCVVNWPMGGRFVTEGLPPGLLMFVDTTGAGISPGVTDLGQRVQLFYTSAIPVASS